MSSSILSLSYTLGEESLTHEALEERFGVEAMKKVFAGTGIRNRRVASRGICGSDLAFDSATRLMDSVSVSRDRVELLIFCTQSGDYILPSSACLLQNRLGLPKNCGSFDLNLGCTQYIYALGAAHGMISAGLATTALVLTGDTMTHTLHPMDRSVVPLLGDGGSATLLTKTSKDGYGFLGFEFGTDGAGWKNLVIPAGGFREPKSNSTAEQTTDKEGNLRSREQMYMNGLAIFHFAIWVVPEILHKLLARLNLKMADVDLFLFHQANKYMLEYLFKKLGIPPERTHVYLEDIGNTSGSSMPIVLTEAIRAGKVKANSVVFMMVFGVGLSWAATVIRWPEDPIAV